MISVSGNRNVSKEFYEIVIKGRISNYNLLNQDNKLISIISFLKINL